MIEKTNEVIELLEVPHLADREMTEMSSGEAHRLLIGRALVHDPLALLLDEPSNSLDFRAALELRDILRKLAQAGTGILMVTHHLPDILPEIDRVILLRQGRVFADGSQDRAPDHGAPHRAVWAAGGAGAPRRLLSPMVKRQKFQFLRSARSVWILPRIFCFFRSLQLVARTGQSCFPASPIAAHIFEPDPAGRSPDSGFACFGGCESDR